MIYISEHWRLVWAAVHFSDKYARILQLRLQIWQSATWQSVHEYPPTPNSMTWLLKMLLCAENYTWIDHYGMMMILFAVTNLAIWNMTVTPWIPATYNLGTLYQEQGKANYTWRDHYGIHGPGMAQVQAWPRLGAGMAQAGVSSMSHLDNIYI
jgi:hypothetical protein